MHRYTLPKLVTLVSILCFLSSVLGQGLISNLLGTSATTTSSADATTGSPQAKSIGSRVSGLVSSLRGGNAQDTASQSNADDPPKTIGNRLSDLASSVLGRGANSSTSTFARASNLTSDEPPKTIGTRLSDAVSSVGTSLGTSLTKTLVGTKTASGSSVSPPIALSSSVFIALCGALIL